MSLDGRKPIQFRPKVINFITFGGNTKEDIIENIKINISKDVKIKQIRIREENDLIAEEK